MKLSEKSAKKFIESLQNGKIRKSILPNTSLDYSAFQQKTDLVRYKKFLQSFAYDDIKDCEVKKYYGD